MEIDIYQNCPCHSDKKIKFCCGKAIVGDLNRIVELSSSRQPVAALEHIDRTESRLGSRDCLTTLKTHVLLGLREFEQAEQVNREFLQRNPHNPIGYQHQALILASRGEALAAVEALQDAMDLLPDWDVPVSMAAAFRIVGMLLVTSGHLVAGREHLIFSGKLHEEEALGPMIAQTWRAPEIPLTLKRNFQLAAPAGDAPEQAWFGAWENARRFAERGRWRAAAHRLNLLNEQYPDQPAILDALARLALTLGESDRAVQTWRQLSELPDLNDDERAELQALILTVDRVPFSPPLDFLRVSFPLLDQERMTETIAASPRLVTGSMLGLHYHEEGPPPVAAAMLLDQDEIRSLDEDQQVPDEVPRVVAECLVYGKRTDRPGQVDLFLAATDQADQVITEFCAVLGEAIGPETDRVTVDEISEMEAAMDSRWHLPRSTTGEQRREFLTRQREKDYLETWPDLPLLPLAGQTPREACQSDDQKRPVVAALVLLLEQGADASYWGSFEFDRLRQLLGLPLRQTLHDPGENLFSLSPLAMQRLDFEQLDDDSLISCFVAGSTTGNHRLLRQCLPVLLSRPQLDDEAPFEQVYALLARITPDDEQAFGLMQQARQHAASHQRSVGLVLVMELDLRLQRDRAEGCQELLRTIETRYLQEPQVQYQLALVLQKYGLLSRDGRGPGGPAPPADEPVPVGAQESSPLWTPESGRPAEGPATGKESSKLWLPD